LKIKQNLPVKGAKVEAFACNSREILPQNQEQLRSYSSFLVDQLSVAPMATNTLLAAVLQPLTYPHHSRETVEARGPLPNSPREALIPSSIPGAWPDLQHPLSNPSATITDIDAIRHQHYQHHHHHHPAATAATAATTKTHLSVAATRRGSSAQG
jgi:hypothetical protein